MLRSFVTVFLVLLLINLSFARRPEKRPRNPVKCQAFCSTYCGTRRIANLICDSFTSGCSVQKCKLPGRKGFQCAPVDPSSVPKCKYSSTVNKAEIRATCECGGSLRWLYTFGLSFSDPTTQTEAETWTNCVDKRINVDCNPSGPFFPEVTNNAGTVCCEQLGRVPDEFGDCF